ncbi:hypothetical protein ACJ41O_001194 [Fusarium nematophilum]
MGPENYQQRPAGEVPNGRQENLYLPRAYPAQDYPQQVSPSQGFSQQGFTQQDFSQQTVSAQSFSQQSFSQHSVSPRPYSGQALSPQPYPAQAYPSHAASPQTTSPQSPTGPLQPIDGISPQHTPWIDPLSPDLRDSPDYDRNNDNQRALIGNGAVNIADPKSPSVDVRRSTTALPPSGPLWLRILKSRWSMIVCLVLGVAGALGHHFLYSHLSGREATHQQWWLRLGQLISFIAKANFVVAAMMAHQQVAWRAVGQKGFSVEAVDSLFGSAHNIAELFNREAWVKSWFVMFLALYMWLSPFVVIFTSATLDVVPGEKVEDNLCPSVRTLNFDGEDKESYLTEKKADNDTLTGRSLSGYNVTFAGGNNSTEDKNEFDIFEYYNTPAPPLDRIVSGVFSSGKPIQRENVGEEICGKGWDCSTTIHFVGPGYSCEELAKGVGSEMKDLGNAVPPENLTLDRFVPSGNYSYLADVYRGEYLHPQMENLTQGGIPSDEDGPPFPDHLGSLRTEPIIWTGYSSVEDLSEKHARNRDQEGWSDDYEPTIFACEHWEVNYTVTFNYTAGLQTYNVTQRDYKRKIIDTTFEEENKRRNDGTLDKNVITPEDNYVSPRTDYPRYRKVAAYHSIGLRFRDQLDGNVQVLPYFTADRGIAKTTLLDRHESLTLPNLHLQIRQAYEDLLISLLSDGQLLAVAWAADPSQLSGTGIGGEDTGYACVRRRSANYFDYEWPVLVAVYAVSFTIATIGVYYGISAMSSDGTYTQREMTFSTIAGATKRVIVDESERRETKIRCFPVDERSGDRVYEFRAELPG